jgi:hypothetical protein
MWRSAKLGRWRHNPVTDLDVTIEAGFAVMNVVCSSGGAKPRAPGNPKSVRGRGIRGTGHFILLIQAQVANALNGSALIFPALEIFHITGFALLIGSITLVDLRMLGIGLTRQEPAELNQTLFPWTLVGLVLIFFTGPLMYSTDPDMYYLNWSFLIKMICLAAALIFHFSIHRKSVRQGGTSKAVAYVSLTLWASVVFGGIFIGFVNQGLGIGGV